MDRELKQKIEGVLDEKVRPYLSGHGGGIEVDSLEGGTLRVRLLGQCSGCPSAMLTNEQLIQEEVCAAVPQVKQVAILQEVSEELLAQARAILRGEAPGRG